MDCIDKTNVTLNKYTLGRCPSCGDIIHTGEYLMYFIQKGKASKYDPYSTHWKYVTLQELRKKYGKDPNFPTQLKKDSKFSFLPFDTIACIRPIINYLNSKNQEEYRYKSHYGMINSRCNEEEEEYDD